jgi:SAM-dependent methyltransferase
MDDPALIGAYLLYYWPVSYLEASLAMTELDIHPKRILDIGSGPGPASAAAIDRGAVKIDLADASDQALETARNLLRPTAFTLNTRPIDLESDDCLSSFSGTYDLIIFGHCLNEIRHRLHDRIEHRQKLLEHAASLLSPSGIVLAFEPALLETSRELITVRDAMVQQGYKILNPCPRAGSGNYPCPVLASGPERSCHVEAAWAPPEPVASLAAAAGLDRNSVKFSYFAFHGESVVEAKEMKKQKTGTDILTQATGSTIEGRVISDPMLNKAGRIRYILCSNGSLLTVSASKKSSEVDDAGFFSLKRGDYVRLRGVEPRQGGGFGIGPDSSIEIVTRFPEIDP